MIPLLLLLAADLPCFTVQKMVRSDDTRFYVEAVSRCKTFLPAAYVRVVFEPQGIASVWPVYGVSAGQRVRHEFRVPVGAEAFKSIRAVGVVSTIEEGLRP